MASAAFGELVFLALVFLAEDDEISISSLVIDFVFDLLDFLDEPDFYDLLSDLFELWALPKSSS